MMSACVALVRKLGFLVLISPAVQSLYVSGELISTQNWAFLARFCFLSSQGSLNYSFDFPLLYQPQMLLLYYDEPDQWQAVYKTDLTCVEKISPPHIVPENNQAITLDVNEAWSGCYQGTGSLNASVHCEATRMFAAARARWWYLAVSRCQNDSTYVGLQLSYTMHMTNGDGLFQREFSADEMHILEVDITFLLVTALLLVLALAATSNLRKRQLFHTTYKLYLASLSCDAFYLLVSCIVYGKYANDGLYSYASQTFADVWDTISVLIFVLMLLLMGKGFTITRGRISTAGAVKMAVFMVVYTTTYAILFVYGAVFTDPGEVLYIYESPPGYGILIIRAAAWLYFSYACFFSIKHYPEKYKFYFPFYCFYTVWFLIGPIFVLVAYFAWPDYQRAKIVNGIDQGITFLAQAFLLFLTRPTNTNKNFPYHVRTSQIAILAAEDGKEMNNFSQYAYAPGDDAAYSGPDFTNLFSVARNVYAQENGGRSEEEHHMGNGVARLASAPAAQSSRASTTQQQGTAAAKEAVQQPVNPFITQR